MSADEWTWYQPLPWRLITFIDRTETRWNGVVLRRRSLGGRWEYRSPTPDELEEWQLDRAW